LIMGELKSRVDAACVDGDRTKVIWEAGGEIQHLINLLPDPIVVIDATGKFLMINDRVKEITGFTASARFTSRRSSIALTST